MLLQARDLTKTFRDASGSTIEALTEVSLSIAPLERVALLGESGSGKTTLLRLLNGTLVPTRGSLSYDGTSPATDRRGIRRRIATIYQQHYLVPGLPVYQNVLAGRLGHWGTWKGIRSFFWPSREDLLTAEEVLAQVGLTDKLVSRTLDLSGGQQQRVAIARALIQTPTMILADEPTASLDPGLTEEIMALLVGICERQGKTLIASLHDLSLAKRYFERAVALKNGRIVFDGSPQTLTDSQLSEIYSLQ